MEPLQSFYLSKSVTESRVSRGFGTWGYGKLSDVESHYEMMTTRNKKKGIIPSTFFHLKGMNKTNEKYSEIG